MCGRFAIKYNTEDLLSQFGEYNLEISSSDDRIIQHHDEAFNVAPSQRSAVYRSHAQDLDYMKWGLVPHWIKDLATFKSYSTFNARVESLLESKIWSGCLGKKRCVVPVSGYYEWKTSGKNKTPYYVTRNDGKLTFLAGMYDYIESENLYTFTIITNEAPEQLKWLHPRMPVVLEPNSKEWDTWMDKDKIKWFQTELNSVLKSSFEDKYMLAYQVSKNVGKITSKGESLTKRILMKDKFSFVKKEDNIKQEDERVPSVKIAIKSETKPEIKESDKKSKLGFTNSKQLAKPRKRSITDMLQSSSMLKKQKR